MERMPHLSCMTKTTRMMMAGLEPERNMHNRKPYRTAAQKEEARRTYYRHNGTYYSNAPKSYHPAP